MTDQAIDLFERLVGTMFSKAETRHARAFQADGRAINEKVLSTRGSALRRSRRARPSRIRSRFFFFFFFFFGGGGGGGGKKKKKIFLDAYERLGKGWGGVPSGAGL